MEYHVSLTLNLEANNIEEAERCADALVRAVVTEFLYTESIEWTTIVEGPGRAVMSDLRQQAINAAGTALGARDHWLGDASRERELGAAAIVAAEPFIRALVAQEIAELLRNGNFSRQDLANAFAVVIENEFGGIDA